MSSRPQNQNLMSHPDIVRMLLPIYGRRWMPRTIFLINFVHKSPQSSLVPASINVLGVSFCPGDVWLHPSLNAWPRIHALYHYLLQERCDAKISFESPSDGGHHIIPPGSAATPQLSRDLEILINIPTPWSPNKLEPSTSYSCKTLRVADYPVADSTRKSRSHRGAPDGRLDWTRLVDDEWLSGGIMDSMMADIQSRVAKTPLWLQPLPRSRAAIQSGTSCALELSPARGKIIISGSAVSQVKASAIMSGFAPKNVEVRPVAHFL
ncbi:hypothetical protein B0H13DRAFT_1854949 [Mycena leptocephala]|nr:hypothetical protein B0H13DRAFT_1854949 [Mycena leptocephala]